MKLLNDNRQAQHMHSNPGIAMGNDSLSCFRLSPVNTVHYSNTPLLQRQIKGEISNIEIVGREMKLPETNNTLDLFKLKC
jgi:hypothetical protein